MRLKTVVTVAAASLVFVGARAQYGGMLSLAVVQAEDAPPPQPKGVTTRPLVGSTGVLPRIAASVPIVFTGQVVELAPGGQTGKQRTLVPSYVYVLEGVLTIDTEGGPTGVSGVQYHGTGHSYAPPPGLWFNAMNNGTTPVRYLFLLVGTPGGPTTEMAKAED